MRDSNPDARLSANAAKVLLSLLLARREAEWSVVEFATLTGLPVVGWSIPIALGELADHGLVTIVPHSIGVLQGRELMPRREPFANEIDDSETGSDHDGPYSSPDLSDQQPTGTGGVVDAEGVRETIRPSQGQGSLTGGAQSVESGQQDFDSKLAALRKAWDEAFPPNDYKFQRLTVGGAHRLLSGGREVEAVRQVILDAPHKAKVKIQNPLSYVLAVLSGMEREDARKGNAAQEDGVVITDDLRRLTELGRRRYAAQTEDGG